MSLNKKPHEMVLLIIQLKDCIIIVSDSHVNRGDINKNKSNNHFTLLNNHILCCYSTISSDIQFATDYLKSVLTKSLNYVKKKTNVRVVAQIMREIYKKTATSSCVCAGWDLFHGNQFYLISQKGSLFKQNFLLMQNNSVYLDKNWILSYGKKKSYHFSRKFALEILSTMITLNEKKKNIIKIYSINRYGIKTELITPFSEIKKFYFSKKSINRLI
nr:26S proteasome, beta-1 SU [Cryptomonas paramecium]